MLDSLAWLSSRVLISTWLTRASLYFADPLSIDIDTRYEILKLAVMSQDVALLERYIEIERAHIKNQTYLTQKLSFPVLHEFKVARSVDENIVIKKMIEMFDPTQDSLSQLVFRLAASELKDGCKYAIELLSKFMPQEPGEVKTFLKDLSHYDSRIFDLYSIIYASKIPDAFCEFLVLNLKNFELKDLPRNFIARMESAESFEKVLNSLDPNTKDYSKFIQSMYPDIIHNGRLDLLEKLLDTKVEPIVYYSVMVSYYIVPTEIISMINSGTYSQDFVVNCVRKYFDNLKQTNSTSGVMSKIFNIDSFDENGNNTLFYAIRTGNLEIVKIVVEAGANLNATNAKGISALIYSQKYGNKDILDYIKAQISKSDKVVKAHFDDSEYLHHSDSDDYNDVLVSPALSDAEDLA